MSGKSNYLKNAVLNGILGGPAYTPPGTVYVALYTTAPTAAGGGTEVSGGSYARAAVVNNGTNFPAAASGVKQNGAPIIFPTATAGWGACVAFGIFDAPTGGNLLYFGTLSTTINNGDSPAFGTGALTVTEA